MARVAVLDDDPVFVEMLAAPLRLAGQDVITATVPIDFERLLQFRPQVIAMGLARNARDQRDVRGPEDIMGYHALMELVDYPTLNVLPILLIASDLAEEDIPLKLSYDLFLRLPYDARLYVQKVDELALKVKTRRKISEYVCPNCRARMVYIHQPENLFCPRCGTAVSLIEGDECHALGPEGIEIPCTRERLQPPARHHHP